MLKHKALAYYNTFTNALIYFKHSVTIQAILQLPWFSNSSLRKSEQSSHRTLVSKVIILVDAIYCLPPAKTTKTGCIMQI